MAIKAKNPVVRTPATFDNVEYIDVRFRKIGSNWKVIVKHQLLSESGESEGEFYDNDEPIEEKEVKKLLDKLVAKIVDGTIAV